MLPRTTSPTMPVSSIAIGERHRRDLGDIAGLAESIQRIGLLHPIAVTPDGRLIAGERRLEAVRSLGGADIPVHVVALDEILLGESAENFHRKDWTPSEKVAIAEALEEREREKARQRQTEHGGTAPGHRKDTGGNLPQVSGKTRDLVAKAIGMSGRTYEKAKAVVQAARENPAKFGALQERMDRTGAVDISHRMLTVERIREKAAAEPRREGVVASLADCAGRFRCLYVDPPWEYDNTGVDVSAAQHYPCMPVDRIAALEVSSLAHAEPTAEQTEGERGTPPTAHPGNRRVLDCLVSADLSPDYSPRVVANWRSRSTSRIMPCVSSAQYRRNAPVMCCLSSPVISLPLNISRSSSTLATAPSAISSSS